MADRWTLFALAALVVAASAAGAARRIALWGRGRRASVPILRGLIAAPKRYFVDLHDVVVRDRRAARMHVPTAAGFAAATLLILAFAVTGARPPVGGWLLLACLAVMMAGSVMACLRRFPAPPRRLAGGAWNRLMFSLLAFCAGFAVLTVWALPDAPAWLADRPAVPWIGGLLAVFGVAEMYLGMTWGGPMKHAFAGLLHLAFHPRAERFGGRQISADLRPVDLAAPKFGAGRIEDFAWNRLLGFDTCVHCGRCEAACPAFAAGQPLSPRSLIIDLAGALAAPSTAEDGSAATAVGTDAIWSCTTCRACVHECPMMIEHVDAVVDMRRFLTMERAEAPGKAFDAIADLRSTGNLAGEAPARRANWAVDLDVPVLSDTGATDVLLWVGDAGFHLHLQDALRATVRLMRRSGVDFAILGAEELDCGDLARRLGDDETFHDLARRNIRCLAKYRFNSIVTPDPHALHCLRNEYPALGGRYRVEHHSTFLAEQLSRGRLRVNRRVRYRVTYHDPCYLGRYNGEFAAPRQVLEAACEDLQEMALSGPRSRCCGGGGGAPLTDIPGTRRIPDIRMDDVRLVAAECVAVACPSCTTMLAGVVEPRPAVKDIATLLLEAVDGT